MHMKKATAAMAAVFIFVFANARSDEVPVFDLHFAVITKNAHAHRAATVQQLKKEADIMNRYFVAENGKPVVAFRFKSATLYKDAGKSKCEFLKLGDTTGEYDSDGWAELFNRCDDIAIRDPRAINIYIYDSYSGEEGFKDVTCHGKRNSNRPYLLLDWERLDHRMQSPEEHEMGHAFGLDHITVAGARTDTSTNIMASAESGKGSGGKRDIGFNAEQVLTVKEYAGKIFARLKNN
jgi:hypothetical protein